MLKIIKGALENEKLGIWHIESNSDHNGRALFIHMGKKITSSQKIATTEGLIGESILMVYRSEWFLEDAEDNEILSHVETDDRAYEAAFGHIIGCTITAIEEQNPSEQVVFTFSNGYKLLVFEATELYGEKEDMLYVYREGQKTICYSPAKRFYEAD